MSNFLIRVSSSFDDEDAISSPDQYGDKDENPVQFNDLKIAAQLLGVKIGSSPMYGYDPDSYETEWEKIAKKFKVDPGEWTAEAWVKVGFKKMKTAKVDGVTSSFFMKDEVVLVTSDEESLPIIFTKKKY